MRAHDARSVPFGRTLSLVGGFGNYHIAQIKAKFEVELHERTVGKSGKALALPRLRQLRMTRLQPRPHYPKRDVAAQEAYKRTLRAS